MPAYYSLLAFAFCLVWIMAAGVLSSLLFSRMFAQVNEKLPAYEKMSPWFGHPGVLPEVEGLHRQFYPDSDLRRNVNYLIAAGIAGVICLAMSYDRL